MITRRVFLINLVLFALLFAAAEFAVRQLMAHNATFGQRRSSSIQWEPSGVVQFIPGPSQEILHVEDGALTEDVRFSLNEHGYRGPSLPVDKPRGEVRLAVLGGSHVFDIYAYEYEGNQGWPSVLETHFRNVGLNVRVINGGLPGYSTLNILGQLVFDLPRFSPDIVAVNSTWNDLKWISRAERNSSLIRTPPRAMRPNPFVFRVGVLDHVLGWSSIYRKLRDAYLRHRWGATEAYDEGIIASGDSTSRDFDAGLSLYQDNMEDAVMLIQRMGSIPVLALEERLVSAGNTLEEKRTLEYHYVNVDSHQQLVDLYSAADSVVRDVASSSQVLLIDANSEVEGEARFFVDHVHTTTEGSNYLARRYYELLKPVVEKVLAGRDEQTSAAYEGD
jgi:hypothetical protein